MTEKDRGSTFDSDLRTADDLAAEAIREHGDVPPPAPPATTPKRPQYFVPVFTAVCLAIFVTQIPALRSAFKTAPSIRVGATDTDEDTDACIDTLWKISAVLQYGSLRGSSVLEPVTQRPYLVRQADGDTIVECPNPAAHNLRSLQVSAAHRAPEAVK